MGHWVSSLSLSIPLRQGLSLNPETGKPHNLLSLPPLWSRGYGCAQGTRVISGHWNANPSHLDVASGASGS